MRRDDGFFGRLASGALAVLGVAAGLGLASPARAENSWLMTATFVQSGADVTGTFIGDFNLADGSCPLDWCSSAVAVLLTGRIWPF